MNLYKYKHLNFKQLYKLYFIKLHYTKVLQKGIIQTCELDKLNLN